VIQITVLTKNIKIQVLRKTPEAIKKAQPGTPDKYEPGLIRTPINDLKNLALQVFLDHGTVSGDAL